MLRICAHVSLSKRLYQIETTPDHQVSTNDAEPAITNNTNENAPLHVHYSENQPVIIDIQTPAQERKTLEDEIEIIKEVLTPAKEALETRALCSLTPDTVIKYRLYIRTLEM